MRRLTALVAGAVLSLAASRAQALTFDFSFVDQGGTGTVSGDITGLSNNETSAGTLVITSAPSDLSALLNEPFSGGAFAVTNDVITGYSFFYSNYPTNPTVEIALGPGYDDVGYGEAFAYSYLPNPTTFTLVASTPVPEPASLSILGFGLVGLVGIGSVVRRRRRTTAC